MVMSILIGCVVFTFIEKPLNQKIKSLQTKQSNDYQEQKALKV